MMFRGKRLLSLLLLGLVFNTPALAQFDMRQIAVMQGETDGVGLGKVLSGIGDINDDGIEDLAVGQYGKTFIYFGSKNFDTIPDVLFPSSRYISSGDVNGDSIQDLLLSRSYTLEVWIYYGGVSFDTLRDKTLTSPDTISPPFTYFGTKIATGDVNKDGYDDLAIHGNNTRVYFYWGGSDMSTSPAYVLQGPPNYFGSDGLDIGDINGDGYEDLAISMSGHYPDDSTYIYFGGVQLDTIPRMKLKGGFVILGVLNGDGYKDLITVEGTYFGGATMDSIIDSPLCIRGASWAIGNFNNDKYEDLLWGVPTLAGGIAGIYLGSNPLDTIEDWHYDDYEVGDYGDQVGVADINGDGVDEATVGDPGWWWNNPSFPPGRVYIYDNPYTIVQEEQGQLPYNFALYQNYPNPFNSSTIIQYKVGSLEFGAPVRTTLKIYNIKGQLVRVLVDEVKQSGLYQVVWDGKDNSGKEVSSGVYFYQLSVRTDPFGTAEFKDSKKLLLIK